MVSSVLRSTSCAQLAAISEWTRGKEVASRYIFRVPRRTSSCWSGRESRATNSRYRDVVERLMQTEKEKASRERRSTIFRSYSRVLCNCRPMHLAGQSFMAEARTRKNVCFNSVLLPSPAPPPVYLLASVAALNYSECANICKIRSSAFSI